MAKNFLIVTVCFVCRSIGEMYMDQSMFATHRCTLIDKLMIPLANSYSIENDHDHAWNNKSHTMASSKPKKKVGNQLKIM